MEPRATKKSYARYCTDDRKPYRQYESMTVELRRLVCTCLVTSPGKWLTKGDYHIWLCGTCNRPESYNLHSCIDCGQVFLKDFYATFCYYQTRCWDCCNEFPTPCGQTNGLCVEAEKSKWIPPIYPRPKIFAATELDDFASSLDF